MKKLIAFVIALSLIAGLSASTMAAPVKKKKVVKKPVKKIVKVIKKPVVKPIPAPIVIPVPVAPAPVVVVPMTSKGMGFLLGVNAGMDSGLMGVSGNLDYDLSSMGLSILKVRVGANYVAGANPNVTDNMKAISLKLGLLYDVTQHLKAFQLPLTYYVGGAYLLPVKVNGGRTGVWGAEAYLGANYEMVDFGMINAEVGYGALKYASGVEALRGLDLKIGYRYAF